MNYEFVGSKQQPINVCYLSALISLGFCSVMDSCSRLSWNSLFKYFNLEIYIAFEEVHSWTKSPPGRVTRQVFDELFDVGSINASMHRFEPVRKCLDWSTFNT
ncbi:hypothetical protein L1887_36502 [Cichorium endivia]|nr:hypothetical protein L1887_36502 [Cichorium endivia]